MGAPYIDTLHASSLPGVGRVCVYKNLNRPGYYSVAAVKGSMGRGKVVAYARTVYLRNTTNWIGTSSQKPNLPRGPDRPVHRRPDGASQRRTDHARRRPSGPAGRGRIDLAAPAQPWFWG